MQTFFAILQVRFLELLRDKTTWVWNVIFPVVLIIAIALIFKDQDQELYKVGVSQSPINQFAAFKTAKHIQFVDYPELATALDKLKYHQLDLVIAGENKYWVNDLSAKSYLLEKILLGIENKSRLIKASLTGRPIRYLDWVLPGILGINIANSALTGVGLGIVRNRKNGVLKRLGATPLGAFEFLTAQVVTRFLMLMLTSVILFFAMSWIFDIMMRGSYGLLLLVASLGCMSLISLGLLFASRTESEEAAVGMLNLLILPMVFLSGVWFSLEGSAEFLQQIALLFPLTHMLNAARNIMLENAGVSEIYTELLVLSGMTVFFLSIASLRFKWYEDKHIDPEAVVEKEKQTTINLSSELMARVAQRIVRIKWPILMVIVATTWMMAYGAMTRTQINTDQNSFLAADDPAIQALDKFKSQFGSDDSVLLVYKPLHGDVFSTQALKTLDELTKDLENSALPSQSQFPLLKHIRRVRSLSNIRVQSADGDTLRSDKLVPFPLPNHAAQMDQIRQKAMQQEDYIEHFYAADGQYAAILIETDFGAIPTKASVDAMNDEEITLDDSFSFQPDWNEDTQPIHVNNQAEAGQMQFEKTDSQTYSQFYQQLQQVFQPYQDRFEFHAVGYAPVASFVQGVIQQSMQLNLVVLLIIVMLLWILFRSFSAVVWPVVVIVSSVFWVIGTFAWLGVTVSSMVTLTILLVLAVGIADSVHVMSAYFSHRREGQSHAQSLTLAYEQTGQALFFTTLTTVVGIAALGFSDLLPIRTFALMSALGVIMAFLMTWLLLPILLTFWHPGRLRGDNPSRPTVMDYWRSIPLSIKGVFVSVVSIISLSLFGWKITAYLLILVSLIGIVVCWQRPLLNKIWAINLSHAHFILIMSMVVLSIFIYGATQVKIDSNITELTREDSEIRVAYQTVDKHLSGAQNMEIMIDTGVSDGVLHPDLLAKIDLLQKRIEFNYPLKVGSTFSLVNIVKDTNQILHQDNAMFHHIPDSQKMIAQQLYLFNSANPEDRRSIVADDYSQTHISIRVHNAGSQQYQQFYEEINQEIEQIFADMKQQFPQLDVTVTGSIPLYMRTQGAIAKTQFNSFAIALTIVSLLMVFTLRSFQAGLLSIVPNILPALFTFGLMGMLCISLDADTLLIAPVIIGIAVDDTIHFMTHYRQSYTKTQDIAIALKNTLQNVGQAVMFTSMILGMGFAVLGFSDYLGTAKMGVFGSLAIFVALLCDLFLLPALILVFKPKFATVSKPVQGISNEQIKPI